jgi:ATP-dependent RNA helicase RhlE
VQAIPVVLAGRDLLGAAQTGTGKTAGFALPLLQRLARHASASTSPARHPVRALVVTPTRELAAQVEESVRTYGKYVGLHSTVIYGGVGMQPQIDALRRGVDIVVGTPGRLLDHVQQKMLDLRQVEILVLDEADRMLDMGFIHDIKRILALVPPVRQNLLFSATFPDEIRHLAASFMKDPATVEVARRNTPAELVGQVVHPVDAARKRELLAHLVTSNDWRQVLVFVKTKHGANRLAQQLSRDGVEADSIHGNKSQNARTRALAQFKEGELRVLVATDIAARGLDIEALPHVVNYDLPHVAEDYVHRIGRTGRAGVEGEAVTLVSPEDRPLMAAIEKLINRQVEQRVVSGFEPGTRPSQKPLQGAPKPHHPRPERQRPEHRKRSPEHRQEHRRAPSPQRPPSPQRAPSPQRPPLVATTDSEREAQIREARDRMAVEGEAIPPQLPPRRDERRPDSRRAEGRPPKGKGARRQPRRPADAPRTSQARVWDPRRAEPQQKEIYHHAPRHVEPRITTKRTRAIPALLARKTEES